MNEVGHLKYSLSYGFAEFFPVITRKPKDSYFDGDVFIDIYFNKVDISLAQKAFIDSLLRFSQASLLANKLFENLNDIDYTSTESDEVREKCEAAIFTFKRNLKDAKKSAPLSYLPLKQYIDQFYGGSQARFAQDQKTNQGKSVDRRQVNNWIKKGFVISASGTLYSPRRKVDVTY